MTLIISSVIITILTMCINITYKTSEIINLRYIQSKTTQKAMSGIELVEANIKKEIEILSEIEDKEYIKHYLKSNDFIENISKIDKSKINEINLNISSSVENNKIVINIVSEGIEKEYLEVVNAKIELINIDNQISINKRVEVT